MEQHLQDLVERARSGDTERFQELVAALRTAGQANPAVLEESVRSSEAVLRRAIIAAAQGQTDSKWLDAVAGLVRDPSREVRANLAEAIAACSWWPLDKAVETLLGDDEASVRFQAARAARLRPALEPALVLRLGREEDWQVRQVIARVLAVGTPSACLPALVAALAQDNDRGVSEACAGSIETLLVTVGQYPPDLYRPRLALLEEAHRRVDSLGSERFPTLAAWLGERLAVDVDLDRLRSFGLLLTADAGRLPHAHGVDPLCEAVLSVLTGGVPRAAVLLGEPGSGKTAIVQELACRLHKDPDGPWHILRVTPSELLAGTLYLGEWQTRVRDLIKAIRSPRRVILYVPNLEELSEAGRSSQSDSNLATALAPHIEAGEITVLGESTPEAFRTGLGAIGSLRRLFHAVEVREPSPAETRTILQAVRDEVEVDVPEPVLDRLLELADYYLAGTAQPGRSVGLLRRVISATAGQPGPVTERDVLTTLSTSTGIPIDFLDDGVPLERGRIRSFFETRVMGQPEAVDAVVDLVALVKAGLTDPGKPFGVLLFVGPTGVGKTELARTLAELLFGDSGRLLRLDMSEFATYDAHERLIGWGPKPGLLTSSVRERPFAVLLFDEIEKAHPNVFDLCLQIFDAGRLTDMQGRTTDFRRTIIILTSNIGSSIAGEGPLGFRPGAAPPPDREGMMRELGRCFRPEFLNRLDRVVIFRPLAVETAEKIARREVARVLERSGIARRRLSVDVDPAVLALLLREGYSPSFGARPLKRTVERLVLLPVAWAIAAGSVPAGSLLRLVTRGGQVEVEVAAPELADGTTVEVATQPSPVVERAATLVTRIAEIRTQAAQLVARKSDLVSRAGEPGFWDDRTAARNILDEIYRLDGILTRLDTLDRSAHDDAEQAARQRTSERDLARIQRRVEILESQAEHLAFLVACRDVRDLGDAFTTLTLVSSHGAGLDAVALLARMYIGLAGRRGLEVEVLDDHQGGNPSEDSVTLLISGAGAYALLAGEAGLHQVARGQGEHHTDRRKPVDRDVVRVEVLRVPAGDIQFAAEDLRVEAQALEKVKGRVLPRLRLEIQLLHRPSMISVRAWTDKTRVQAIERLRPLLWARVEGVRAGQAAAGGSSPPLVRRYMLGPSPSVRDLRLNRSTGRLDQVLKGHLDTFLIVPRQDPAG